MTWFKVDDGLAMHRKVLSIPRGGRRLAAIGAWTIGGAWSSGNLTEGRLPKTVLDDLGVPAKVAADLCGAGLWIDLGQHYQMHDFLMYNPSADKVGEVRAAATERQRRARERAQKERTEAKRHAVTHMPVTCEVTSTVTGGRHGPPGPSRPVNQVLTPPAPSVLVPPNGRRTSPATSAPADFPLTEALIAWGREHAPAVNGKTETENWLDWHRAKGDTAKDWQASWRTWMRRAQKDTERNNGRQTPDRIAYGDRVLAEAHDRAVNGMTMFGMTPLRAISGGNE